MLFSMLSYLSVTQDSPGMSEKEGSSLQPESVNKSKATPEKLAPTDSKKVQVGYKLNV